MPFPPHPLVLKELAGRYYEEAGRMILETVKEPEAREWAITKHKGGEELAFIRKLELEEVEGFIELYHSIGYFEEPKEWEGLLGYDLVIDVDMDKEMDEETLGEAFMVASEIADRLKEFVGEVPSVNFSGSKGFHIRWHYEDVSEFFDLERNSEKKAIGVDDVIESLGYLLATVVPEEYRKFVDLNIYQRNRLIRAVYSINAKTGLPAVPVPDYLVFYPPASEVEAAREVLSLVSELDEYVEAANRVGYRPPFDVL